MRGKVQPFVIGALKTVPKGWKRRLDKLEIGGGVEHIQTTVLLNRQEYRKKFGRHE